VSGDVLDYAAAGVDITASEAAKSRITELVKSTYTQGVLGGIGGFGGLFRMPADIRHPVLVSSADGVGTKIRVAIDSGRHSTIGNDLVNHCVNDILVQGAVPLFFLDYVAFGALDADLLEQIVTGIANGCRENGCALIGGETAEMPGLYAERDYDLAGFIVGAVDETAILGPARVRHGDLLVALESSGLHTNGYSLARKIISERMQRSLDSPFPGMDFSIAEVLLTVHRSYLRAMLPVLDRVHAMAHITGGGIPGNVNRALGDELDAVIDTGTWEVPQVFATLAEAGNIPAEEMYRVFNMGIGMVVMTARDDADEVIQRARVEGVTAWVAGEVERGGGNVRLV
jgi:phosphoribosylformylglycinamidine cyclo-ligase